MLEIFKTINKTKMDKRSQSSEQGKMPPRASSASQPKQKAPRPGSCKTTRPVKPSTFKLFYSRGDLPISVDQYEKRCKIKWKIPIHQLDYHIYLPVFFDGLRLAEEPYSSIARQGVQDLLDQGGQRILKVIPQIVMPIKYALESRDKQTILATMHALQHLAVSSERVGEALVPYYRQILPVFNALKGRNLNCGDNIDYGQRKHQNIGDCIEETLETLEKTGGKNAFINIKYMIPTYESHVMN